MINEKLKQLIKTINNKLEGNEYKDPYDNLTIGFINGLEWILDEVNKLIIEDTDILRV